MVRFPLPKADASLSRPRVRRRYLAAILALCLAVNASVTAVQAVQPDEVLPDARMEARARQISAGLRCLVCQNQSIDDSNAPLARDLRLLVRERLQAGDSDEAVVSYVVQRYGEFVLLRPPVSLETVLLWVAPLLLLAGGAVVARRQFRSAGRSVGSRGAAADAPLSAEEARRLDQILNKDG